MLIGIDASRANLQNKTGTEWYSYFLIQELKKLDTQNQYRLYSKEPLTGDLGNLPSNFQSRVLAWPPRFLWTQKRLAWEMLVRPPEVLFVPAHGLPVFSRARMVVTIHDVGFRVNPELYYFKDIWYHRFCVWYASHFAKRIICPSEFTKQEVIKYYPASAGKITVIPHGVSENLRSEKKPAAENFLLFVGRLEKKKNLLGMLQALMILRRKFSDLKLVLAGRPGYGWEEAEQFIAENNLQNSVVVKGYVSEAERDRLYAEARAFLFPTFYEGFGLPILEAQSRGCPVITSRGGAHQEVAGDSAPLVDPKSPQEIAAAAEKFLTNPQFRLELSDKGLQNAAKYSWRSTAEKTLQVLNSISR
jgi:glycosyltransferase involved in cell wall biosynthesis